MSRAVAHAHTSLEGKEGDSTTSMPQHDPVCDKAGQQQAGAAAQLDHWTMSHHGSPSCCCCVISCVCCCAAAAAKGLVNVGLCAWLAQVAVEYHRPRSLALHGHVDTSCSSSDVYTVREDDALFPCFARLLAEGVQGCAVVDESGRYVDQIDVLEILFFVCELFKASQSTAPSLTR